MGLSVVVTGANGFIGNHIVEKILKLMPGELTGEREKTAVRFSNFETTAPLRDELAVSRVWGVDLLESLTRPTHARFAGASRYTFVEHTKLFDMLETLEQPPALVVHNGACSTTTETDPEIFAALNLNYSKQLWTYCARKGVPFIYASSASVYGDGSKGFSDLKKDCAQFVPMHLYGKSKHDFDLWVLEQSSTPPTWFGLRYFNVYGPFEGHKKGQASMVSHGYTQASRTGKIKLYKSNTPEYSDGNQLRDFVYVQDIVRLTLELAHIAASRSAAQRAQTAQPAQTADFDGNGMFLNVGTGTPRSWNDLAKAVFESLSLPANIEYIPMPDNLLMQYQNYTCAELSTWKALGLQTPLTPLEQGVQEYVQRYLMRGL